MTPRSKSKPKPVDANGKKVDPTIHYQAITSFYADPLADRKGVSARAGDTFLGEAPEVQLAPDKFVRVGDPEPRPVFVTHDHDYTPPRRLLPIEDMRIATQNFHGPTLGRMVIVYAGEQVHKDDELAQNYAQYFREPTPEEIAIGNLDPGRSKEAA